MVHLRLRICFGLALLPLLSALSAATLVTIDPAEITQTATAPHTFSILPTKDTTPDYAFKARSTQTSTPKKSFRWTHTEPTTNFQSETTETSTQINISSLPFANISYKPL